MPLHVQRQVVAPGEGPLAERALEWPVAGVLPVMARQLVGSGELPAAALPVAVVRLLAGVRAQVRLQVRALRVRLRAAGMRARVAGLPLPAPRASAALLRSWSDLGRRRPETAQARWIHPGHEEVDQLRR